MKIKYFLSLFMAVVIAASAAFAFAQNQNESAIQYPVEELGSCKDKQDCKNYCDKKENMEACVAFAEKNKIMSEEEVRMAKNFLKGGGKGPGGCTGKESCKAYCDDINHINECVSYAEENGLMPAEQLQEAKKVQAAIAKGIKPPACGNKEACDAYCESSDHMEECISFGEAAGFLQGKELEDSKKMLAAVKKGVKAPPCKGKEACDEYCTNPDNMELCMNFAMEAGFMSEAEKADSQKMLQALKKGAKPPKCKGQEECDAYCAQEEHIEECIAFSEAAGFMSEEDAAMARKTGGKGPGGCKGKTECENFCNSSDNQEVCFNFAKENGMIPEADLKQMEEGRQRMKQTLEQAPPAVLECLTSQYGAEAIEKMKNGALMPSKNDGDKMKICFEKMGPPSGNEGMKAGGMMPSEMQGPGGCKTAEECQAYCQANPQACANFKAPISGSTGGGSPIPYEQMQQQMQQQTGPGGCKSPEECKIYCESNPEECAGFKPPQQGSSGGSEGQGPMPYQQMNNLNPIIPTTQTGPGGCKSPEECKAYCSSNPQACAGFQPPSGTNTQMPQTQYVPPSGQPNIQPPAGQNYAPQQPMPPANQQQPPAENPPAQPSSSIKPASLLGSIIQAFVDFFKF